jgi:hypothetical protein
MWETELNWADAQLQSIRAPVPVADGDHDEAIKRAPHIPIPFQFRIRIVFSARKN